MSFVFDALENVRCDVLAVSHKPRIDTGRYMLTTPTYAQNTEIGNLEHFFMSVWIVGKVEAPPNENNIVPKAKRKGEIRRTQQHWGMNIRFTLDKTYHPHFSCEILATQWIALTDDWNVNISRHILVKKSCHFFITLDNLVSRLGHTETIGSLCSEMDHRCSQNVVRKNKRAHEAQPVVSLMFLPHFDVFCDLLLYRPTAT